MDDRAHAQWLATIRPQLVAYAFAHCGSHTDAEDVASLALIRLYLNRSRIDHTRNAHGYALRITKHLCFDRHRNAKRKPTVSIEAAATVPDGTQNPLDHLIMLESHAKALARLRRLAPIYEAVLLDCGLYRLSYADCARKRGVTLGVVRHVLNRLRTRFQAISAQI